MMVEDEKPFVFLVQVQQVFFMDEEQNPSWKVVVQKEFRSSHIMTNTCVTLSGINDGCATAKHTHDTPTNATRCNLCGHQGAIDKGIGCY
jgi:hypothetical protein